MSTVTIHDASGPTSQTADLPTDIFAARVNIPLIHQVVVAQLAAARQGTHAVKTRGQVAGGGAKPYRQKGTGRARQGSIRAPQFAGGGAVHGPVPRDYSQRTPKKMKAAALRGALSDRASHNRVHVVTTFVASETPSTKEALRALEAVTGGAETVLAVIESHDVVDAKSLRNLPHVHVLFSDQVNTYDVLCSDTIVFTKGALDSLVERIHGSAATAKPATTQRRAVTSPKTEAKVETGPYGADSAKPLADGSNPSGFEIKGNSDSMKYHLPGGRWYDSTVAEVWFRTEDAAKAAGFVKAGTRVKSEEGKS